MRSIWSLALLACLLAFLGAQDASAEPVPIKLDADSPARGSNLDTSPLITPFGTITFIGEIAPVAGSDTGFINAGAAGYAFDIDGTSSAALHFDFDVSYIKLIY